MGLGDDAIILILRMGVVAILYSFLIALVVLTQRELRHKGATRDAPAGQTRLIVVRAGTATQSPGQVIALAPVTRFGRAEDNTVVLDDDFVSSTHALVILKNGRWWVRDEGSTNGTAVNGSVISAETALSVGDELQIGSVLMRLAE